MDLLRHSTGENTIVKVAVTADGTPIRDDHFDAAAGDRMVEYVPASQLRGAVEAERARIVAWLRTEPSGYIGPNFCGQIADLLEADGGQ